MTANNTQVMHTYGVDVTMDEHGRIELNQYGGIADENGTIAITEDEARLLVMRLGRRLGMHVSYSEGQAQ